MDHIVNVNFVRWTGIFVILGQFPATRFTAGRENSYVSF